MTLCYVKGVACSDEYAAVPISCTKIFSLFYCLSLFWFALVYDPQLYFFDLFFLLSSTLFPAAGDSFKNLLYQPNTK